MESLNDSAWDVLISGTGISQSLLALALSRSGKKVLHIDRNDYYGGPEAALSLQEVANWVGAVKDESRPTSYANATLLIPTPAAGNSQLGFSRAYSVSLSPKFIYTRSNLIPALVSSKVYRQLEFLAVGSWWIYDESSARLTTSEGSSSLSSEASQARLFKIPGSREDVFQDKSIDLRSTRSLMKFLKVAADIEGHTSFLERWGQTPFPTFLTSEFNIPERLQPPLLALTSSLNPPAETPTSYALPRIHRHLTSIGLLGLGFGAVIPKWGGLAEIAQVACRAGAVGGGVYVLKKGIDAVRLTDALNPDQEYPLAVSLERGENIRTRWVVGTQFELPLGCQELSSTHFAEVSYSVTIISSALSKLFPVPVEGAPSPAGAVIVFLETQPVYLIVHSSDTGECPDGQSIIYAQTSLPHPDGFVLLARTIQNFLATIPEDPKPEILWTLNYIKRYPQPTPSEDPSDSISVSETNIDNSPSKPGSVQPRIIKFPEPGPDLAIEDFILRQVKSAWERIVGDESGNGFMLFEDRGGAEDEGAEEEY